MELFSSWTGGDFLLFYMALLGLATFAAWWIPAHLREPGRAGRADELEDIALLTGGRERLADSLIADLFVRGGLVMAEQGKLAVADLRLPTTPGGKALLASPSPLTLADARKVLAVHAERVAARLRRAGLLLRPEEAVRLRWLSILPFAAVFLLGLYRQRAGSAVGEPTGLLVLLLGLTVLLAVIRFARSDPRTVSGFAEVERLRTRNARCKLAPRPEEAALAVALFGSAVLVGTPWEPVHAMRQQDGDSGSGGDSSSGSGDSGCGGGGCGGCGG
jgi:uncharacterized protein (TIGR04222 family)